MERFNFEPWKNKNVAMHCKTEEEAIEFCNIMHEHGLKWGNGNSYLEFNHWYVSKEETCYNFNIGAYSPLDFYKQENYTILEWSEYSLPKKKQEGEKRKKRKKQCLQTQQILKKLFLTGLQPLYYGEITRELW